MAITLETGCNVNLELKYKVCYSQQNNYPNLFRPLIQKIKHLKNQTLVKANISHILQAVVFSLLMQGVLRFRMLMCIK